MSLNTNLFDELQLFRGKDFKVNDYISIHHPTLDEICDIGEWEYYSDVSLLTCTPSQYKVQLFDMGIDYATVSDYEFFLMMYRYLSEKVSRLLFCGTNIGDFQLGKKHENDSLVLYEPNDGLILDEMGYLLISEFLRTIHFFEKVIEKPGNEKARKYLIDRDRRKMNRNKDKPHKSVLKPLVSAMVNCEQFKYNHKSVWDMPIYAFNDSVRQIQKVKNYDSLMFGVYSGNVDTQKINQKDLTWIRNSE